MPFPQLSNSMLVIRAREDWGCNANLETKTGERTMRKTALILAAAASLAVSAPAEARGFGHGGFHHGGFGPGLAGGLIAGAVIGGLASSAYGYGYGPYGYYGDGPYYDDYAPVYYGGGPYYSSYAPAYYGYRYRRVVRPAFAYY